MNGKITGNAYWKNSLFQELKKKYEVPEARYRYRTYRSLECYLFRRGALDTLGGKCVKCEFSDWRALEIDHKEGGGGFERRVLKISQRELYQLICRKEINLDKYQVLCSNCHQIKGYEAEENCIAFQKSKGQGSGIAWVNGKPYKANGKGLAEFVEELQEKLKEEQPQPAAVPPGMGGSGGVVQ